MKNGQIPDHWQLWLWIGIAALILAALARQSAIDTGGMSTFNANLVFGGIIVLFGLLYLALHEFFTKKFGAQTSALNPSFVGLASKRDNLYKRSQNLSQFLCQQSLFSSWLNLLNRPYPLKQSNPEL